MWLRRRPLRPIRDRASADTNWLAWARAWQCNWTCQFSVTDARNTLTFVAFVLGHKLKLKMATKKSKAAPTDDELNKLLEGIEDEAQTPVKGASKSTKAASSQSEQDLLAELENLGAQQPPSRPHTPRIQSVKRATTATPPPGSSRNSEEKASGPRKSAESTRSYHTSFTPSATSSDLQEAERKAPVAQPAEPVEPAASTSSGGGWWGGIFATASAAVKTAEAAVKEIQHNEEAKRWAEQVKGNIGVLQGFGKTAVAIPII